MMIMVVVRMMMKMMMMMPMLLSGDAPRAAAMSVYYYWRVRVIICDSRCQPTLALECKPCIFRLIDVVHATNGNGTAAAVGYTVHRPYGVPNTDTRAKETTAPQK